MLAIVLPDRFDVFIIQTYPKILGSGNRFHANGKRVLLPQTIDVRVILDGVHPVEAVLGLLLVVGIAAQKGVCLLE